ncbi:MAG: RNA-binding S4 domain-containing protein [Alphaproteobacteria bacterium]|jgi:ribosome-associated heat shock protein Hsp15|nr:RNA-binding S4 domain-containing protein [Alphaproteobacteria bacterium]MDP6813717.1 RNA-binding S4 domain-containing protein [Alphaproteobacteria bacterium]
MTDVQRLDRWLWFARFFKSRTIAAKACNGHKVRVNRQVVAKASTTVKAGDVLTFPQGPHIRVVKVLDLGQRRGPAPEAQTLYEDLAPPGAATGNKPSENRDTGQREAGSGRPTKRQRRVLDRLQGRSP